MEINDDIERETTEDMFDDTLQGDDSLYVLYFAENKNIADGGRFWSSDHWDPEPDYVHINNSWFTEGKNAASVAVTSPYIDEQSNNPITTITCKVNKNGSFAGLTAVDIQLTKLTEIVSDAQLSPSGKSFILTADGAYLTNENPDKILSKNFYDDFPELKKFKNQLSIDRAFMGTTNGKYFSGRKISNETNWYFVSIGPEAELYAAVRKSLTFVILISIISIIISLGIAVLISTKIVKPIKIVASTVNGIASGNADLTNRISTSTHDEVAVLVHGFNGFVEKLQTIVNQIKGSKNDLSDVEDNLQKRISDTNSSIQKILGNIDLIGNQIDGQANAVSQTSAAVAEIAENINSLERMIENQSGGVSGASSAVEEMIGNINSVNSSVEKMAESFASLEQNAQLGIEKQKTVSEEIAQVAEQSKALQEANKTIENIAKHTNLLAMNAAIEAAHAGDSGKGFSVVADEIRKLSETSSEQSKKIGAELSKIQETINKVVSASVDSSENFNQINGMISSTDQLVRQIKSAMEEQQLGSKQIVDALKTMNDSTAEVRIASSEMAEGNRLILDEVHNLQNSTYEMKNSMSQMTEGAEEMKQTGSILSDISTQVRQSVTQIGNEIDTFRS